ncbi:hypothetical protein DPX16_20241 [Anabarilius grahami]|uniref:Uncharacterized protein n=1 Tax=Anabarilius grahami TaxID=495550 RepID=A0A3N0XEE5_ANAGA|nr:hypothetical protein DPX16_20241 [Anabarilius grahami]
METQAKSNGRRDRVTPEEQEAVLKSVNDLPWQSHRDESGQRPSKDDGPRWSRGSKEPRWSGLVDRLKWSNELGGPRQSQGINTPRCSWGSGSLSDEGDLGLAWVISNEGDFEMGRTISNEENSEMGGTSGDE